MGKRHLMGLPFGIVGIAIIIAFVLSMTGTQPSPVDRNGNTLSEAVLQDMRTIADTEGISHQAAVDNYGWHNDFARMVSDVRSESPDDFSAGGISGDSAAWVAFTGTVPPGAPEHVGRFLERHPSISVESLTDVGFTEAESSAALKAAHYTVMDSPDVTDAGSSFDFQTRRIEITANVGTDSPPASLMTGLRRDAEAAVAEAVGADMLDLIEVEVVGVGSVTGGVD